MAQGYQARSRDCLPSHRSVCPCLVRHKLSLSYFYSLKKTVFISSLFWIIKSLTSRAYFDYRGNLTNRIFLLERIGSFYAIPVSMVLQCCSQSNLGLAALQTYHHYNYGKKDRNAVR